MVSLFSALNQRLAVEQFKGKIKLQETDYCIKVDLRFHRGVIQCRHHSDGIIEPILHERFLHLTVMG